MSVATEAVHDFQYKVTLLIHHDSIDPLVITHTLHEFPPKAQVRVGDIRPRTGRPAPVTIWTSSLQEDPVYDSLQSLSYLLSIKLQILLRHRDFIKTLASEGSVSLHVEWFAGRTLTVAEFDNDVLSKCGELGCKLEVSVYNYEVTKVAMPENPNEGQTGPSILHRGE